MSLYYDSILILYKAKEYATTVGVSENTDSIIFCYHDQSNNVRVQGLVCRVLVFRVQVFRVQGFRVQSDSDLGNCCGEAPH